MEEYVINRKKYTKNVVFLIPYFQGGIGDLIKFFTCLVQLCIEHKIKIHYYLTNLAVNKFLLLKHPELYLSNINTQPINLSDINDLNIISDDKYYIVQPHLMYKIIDYSKLYLKGSDIFYFSKEVIERSKTFKLENYISIHVRLGDKYLEIPAHLIQCITDVRPYDEDKISKCIEKNINTNIVLFCDNLQYKQKMKEKYPFIHLTDFKIGHTALPSTTDENTIDTLAEFYLLSKSQKIFIANESGFPVMSSKFYNIPLLNI
jgi:hypothetical protein